MCLLTLGRWVTVIVGLGVENLRSNKIIRACGTLDSLRSVANFEKRYFINGQE